ncbi:hypothetical protein WME75_32315 [Sorangium sp. So ce1014]
MLTHMPWVLLFGAPGEGDRALLMGAGWVIKDEHHLDRLVDVVGELIGVPRVLVVAAVGVDAAEHAVVRGHLHLVVHGVAGERRVVRLEVELEVLVQAVPVGHSYTVGCLSLGATSR